MIHRTAHFPFALLLLIPAMAQTTTEFTANLNLPDETPQAVYGRILVGSANVGTLGRALVTLNRNQQLGSNSNSGVGPVGGALTLALNRSDQITISNSAAPDPDAETVTIPGRVMSGTGVYAGATGPVGSTSLTLMRTSVSPLRYTLSLTGAATVAGQAVDLAITNAQVEQAVANVGVFDNLAGTGTSTELGDFTIAGTARPDTNNWETATGVHVNVTMTFSPDDSLRVFFNILEDPPPPSTPVTVIGGTGAYAGASGTAVLNFTGETSATIAGSVTQPGPTTPVITQVNTASGSNPISQNAWIEILGTNLAPPDTPAGGMFWGDAPEFLRGMMPTELGGVSVTVNGKPAFVWWFCSAATTPTCASDQINALAPLDDFTGQMLIEVKNGSARSGALLRFKNVASPAFLLFSPKGDVAATHADGSLVGPTALYPGASTPASRGETVSLWGVGFGLPTAPLVAGSSTQSGSLPLPLRCLLNGEELEVVSALVSPGLYQVNATISLSAEIGDDNRLWCTYGNTLTPGVLLAVQ